MHWRLVIKWVKAVFTPQYQLTLSEVIKSRIPYKSKYMFKEFGSHEYISLTFEDIKKSENLLHIINPNNLIEISLIESKIQKDYEAYYITEMTIGNNYKLKALDQEVCFSGEYIHKNIDVFQNFHSKDLCEIMYATGFNKGRRVSLALKDVSDSRKLKPAKTNTDNIYNFKPME
ncbi:hypothetical protein [Sodalis sp. C49]|uniref:hypothetical protein n=1 Tax=unclassified Sodalis (in: enterobacteria) TaxID=2636512 RepID=UPI003965A680